MAMVKLSVMGLEFHGKHGVSSEERVVGCRYRADVHLWLDSEAVGTDRIDDTVDYVAVARLVQETSTQNKCLTVERLATLCADAVMDRYPTVESVRVEMSKLLPPTELVMQAFSVAVVKDRDPGADEA